MLRNFPVIDEKLQPLYHLEDTNLRVRRNKILCTLGMILIPVGAFIDYLHYPLLTLEFVLIRVIVVLSLASIYFLHSTGFGRKYIVYLCVVSPLILNLSFSAMIYFSTGVSSRYHTLLSLMILGCGILLPWRVKETVFISLAT